MSSTEDYDDGSLFWTSTTPWPTLSMMERIVPIGGNSDSDDDGGGPEYCGSGVKAFGKFYVTIDTYVAAIICVSGVITNIFNIRILTLTGGRRRSPTKLILTALAVTDFLCVVRKLQRMIVDHFFYGKRYIFGLHRIFTTPALARYDTINIYLFGLLHTWSIYLTLTVGVWRYLGVLYPLKSRPWLTLGVAKWAIFTSILSASLLVTPLTVGLDLYQFNRSMLVHEMPEEIDNIEEGEYFEIIQNYLGRAILIIIHTFLMKLGPCSVMLFITVRLICSLAAAKRSRSKLVKNNGLEPPKRQASVLGQENNNRAIPGVGGNSNLASDNTNKILIVILIIFLASESPWGILNIFSSIFGKKFLDQCEHPLVMIFTLADYVSSTANFFVYCTMSKTFRQDFFHLFFTPRRNHNLPNQQISASSGTTNSDRTVDTTTSTTSSV